MSTRKGFAALQESICLVWIPRHCSSRRSRVYRARQVFPALRAHNQSIFRELPVDDGLQSVLETAPLPECSTIHHPATRGPDGEQKS